MVRSRAAGSPDTAPRRHPGLDEQSQDLLGGRLYYIDIVFPRLKLDIEIDGRLHETDEDLFESDRWRQNALVGDGWRVLRFTWDMLQNHPEVFVAAVCAAIA